MPSARLFNFYGPTETNVCTYYEVTEIPAGQVGPVPIGTACCGNRVWAIRDDGGWVSPGQTGELIVQGPTVMRGYWNREPVSNETYRTGDVVRLRHDGVYECVGRETRW